MDPSKLPLFTRGRSLLSEALSPTTRRRFAGFLDTGTSSEESQMQSPFALSQTQSPAQQKPSPGRRTPSIRRRSALSDADFDRANTSDKSVVWIRCSSRPFRVRLALERGQVVVHGFERSVDKGKRGPPGDVERSGLVQVGDVLVGVNGQTRRFSTLEMVQMALASVEMPVELAFRRVLVVKETLGEYTEKHIVRYLMLQDSLLVRARGVQEAALLVQACIEVFGESKSTVPMGDYIEHVEQVVLPSLGILSDNVAYDRKIRFDQIKQVMETVHQRVDARRKTQVKAWNAAKSSNYRRIEILSRQRASIKERLEKMRENKKELQPENHTLWSEYIELRHLFTQLSENVEKSKQEHYLPDFEGYSLRFGSDGIYVGVGDIWIPSFHAKFSIETRSTAPHLSLHISTPSTHGLKIRVMNFTLATEGRLPSFHCDELNVEAQLVADIPLVFDSISGWTVPQEELDVKLMSFVYYERDINSTKRGKDHDTIMKMFINRMLPSVVRSAAQRLFCVELGPLIQHREAQVVLSGEIKISGRKLAVYDAALNNSNTEAKRATDQNLSETAREMIAISDDEAEFCSASSKHVSQLEPGQTLTPFSVSVVTDEPNEPPKVKVETGDFGKCQYSAQSITLSGTVWQFLKRTQESADDVLRAEGAAASDGVSNPTSTQSGPSDAGEEGCIWDEYLEPPFFSLRFHFFTSCQVSRDHVLLSVGSASLTEPKVAQLKHRVCLGQLLQDLDMLSVVDSNASRRKAGARFQHALRQRAVDTKRHGPSSVSNYSQRQTLFSQSSFTSLDDLDGTSEPASTYETEAHDSTPRQFFQREAADSSAVSSETSQATDFDALPPPIQPNIRSVDRQNSALFF
ncbi:hypothetical protein PR003_g12753 [Phytophthora rubi]|uniref:PDZ domain-containing protein n=1 Tax=Phytophthora rubi TaxID=129364 RepID=A0A6A4F7D4_9STRA|nr:hypothetical protein PR003_g12753 [Phytophthora rubi]